MRQNFTTVECRISSRLKWYKNYKNRLRLAKVIVKNKMSRFLWFSVYMHQNTTVRRLTMALIAWQYWLARNRWQDRQTDRHSIRTCTAHTALCSHTKKTMFKLTYKRLHILCTDQSKLSLPKERCAVLKPHHICNAYRMWYFLHPTDLFTSQQQFWQNIIGRHLKAIANLQIFIGFAKYKAVRLTHTIIRHNNREYFIVSAKTAPY